MHFQSPQTKVNHVHSPVRSFKHYTALNSNRFYQFTQTQQTIHNSTTHKQPVQRQNAYSAASPQQRILNSTKSVEKLKESGDTRVSLTESSERKQSVDNGIKIDEIGNLLSQFKAKYASLQQKYSIRIKSPQTGSINQQFEPMSSKAEIKSKNCDAPINRKNSQNNLVEQSRSLQFASNSNNTFTFLQKHLSPSPRINNNVNPIREKPNQRLFLSPQTQQVKKAQFRATFGPTRNRPINIPVRAIKQAEEMTTKKYRFESFKAVQSEQQGNEQQQDMIESMVIQKYSSTWKKLQKAQSYPPPLDFDVQRTPNLEPKKVTDI